MFASKKMRFVNYILNHMLDNVSNYMLDHVLDDMIIGFLTKVL